MATYESTSTWRGRSLINDKRLDNVFSFTEVKNRAQNEKEDFTVLSHTTVNENITASIMFNSFDTFSFKIEEAGAGRVDFLNYFNGLIDAAIIAGDPHIDLLVDNMGAKTLRILIPNITSNLVIGDEFTPYSLDITFSNDYSLNVSYTDMSTVLDFNVVTTDYSTNVTYRVLDKTLQEAYGQEMTDFLGIGSIAYPNSYSFTVINTEDNLDSTNYLNKSMLFYSSGTSDYYVKDNNGGDVTTIYPVGSKLRFKKPVDVLLTNLIVI